MVLVQAVPICFGQMVILKEHKSLFQLPIVVVNLLENVIQNISKKFHKFITNWRTNPNYLSALKKLRFNHISVPARIDYYY